MSAFAQTNGVGLDHRIPYRMPRGIRFKLQSAFEPANK